MNGQYVNRSVNIYSPFLHFIIANDASNRKSLEVSCIQRSSTTKPFNPFSCRRMSSGMLRRLNLVRTDVSKEHIASIIRVT
jgi:hypothetical protein